MVNWLPFTTAGMKVVCGSSRTRAPTSNGAIGSGTSVTCSLPSTKWSTRLPCTAPCRSAARRSEARVDSVASGPAPHPAASNTAASVARIGRAGGPGSLLVMLALVPWGVHGADTAAGDLSHRRRAEVNCARVTKTGASRRRAVSRSSSRRSARGWPAEVGEEAVDRLPHDPDRLFRGRVDRERDQALLGDPFELGCRFQGEHDTERRDGELDPVVPEEQHDAGVHPPEMRAPSEPAFAVSVVDEEL